MVKRDNRLVACVQGVLGSLRLQKNDAIVAALSGGADSVALVGALAQLRRPLGFRLFAAHLNHDLRGAESERDERFVIELCRRLDVEVDVGRPTTSLNRTIGNLEERARNARYAYLEATANRLGARYIALGHQADDQAETVISRILRGAGVSGLGAMAPQGPGKLIRPMLQVNRLEVLDFLTSSGLSWVEDSSNLSARFWRNRLRRKVMPALERESGPGLHRRLEGLAEEMRDVDDLLRRLADQELTSMVADDGGLDLCRLAQLHAALRNVVLRQFLIGIRGTLRRIDRAHIKALCNLCESGPPNGILNLPGRLIARRQYDRLYLIDSEDERAGNRSEMKTVAEARELPLEGSLTIEGTGIRLHTSMIQADRIPASRDNFEALFDADLVGNRLAVRGAVRGDHIEPLGLGGRRRVSEVFIDHKVPRWQRANYPVVTLGTEVAWLPCMVRSHLALVGRQTRRALRVVAELSVAWK